MRDALVNAPPAAVIARADAIVVLGCRVLASGRPSEALLRRTSTGARAYRAGLAPRVVASGGRRWGAKAEACTIAEELARMGVPDAAIVVELRSLCTRENAHYAVVALAHEGILRVAVATCPWHLPRAIANFRALGVDAFPIADDALSPPMMGGLYRSVHERVCAWNDKRGIRSIDAGQSRC